MKKNILTIEESIRLSEKLRQQGKQIVLVGGCFDILHIGHIKFLESARSLGDVLFVLLESDNNVKKLKGKNRPINPQAERALILTALRFVDFVVLLKHMTTNNKYDKLISQLKPAIIATTKDDPMISHKKRQVSIVGGKLKLVISRIKNKSTSRLAKIIEKEKIL